MEKVTKPIALDETLQRVANAIEGQYRSIEEVVIEDGGDVTAELIANRNYTFTGSLSSLTITLAPGGDGTCIYSFSFSSGSPATVLTLPSDVRMPGGFETETNTSYEVNIYNNRAVIAAWT